MDILLRSLLEFLLAGWDVLVAIWLLVVPWTPLAAWIGFWLFAVDWVRLRQVLLAGGWIPVLLIAIVMIFVWGAVAPPPQGVHHLFGLKVSNYVGKTVYVSGLFALMFLCGAAQLAGCCAGWRLLPEPSQPESNTTDASH